MWNKIAALSVLLVLTSLLLTPFEAEGRRGGGGGGSRGGGSRGGGGRSGVSRHDKAYRGGNTMNRTPTMSRATPARTSSRVGKQQVQPRQNIARDRAPQSRQTVQQRPSSANKSELRNQVNRYASQNSNRQTVPNQSRQNFTNRRANQLTQNRQVSDRVSRNLQARPDYNNMFNRDFFNRHDIDVGYVGNGANLWRPAAWATVASWGAWNWATPYYYDDDGYAYPLTANEYATNTTTTTQSQPVENDRTIVSTSEEWIPLGVFALANNANEASQTDQFMQLSMNRTGEIAGVLYNSTTDQAQDLVGTVDNNSQKAYWSLADQKDSPIASTGIYNLTEDETSIQVHFPNGSNQTKTLVRLQQTQ